MSQVGIGWRINSTISGAQRPVRCNLVIHFIIFLFLFLFFSLTIGVLSLTYYRDLFPSMVGKLSCHVTIVLYQKEEMVRQHLSQPKTVGLSRELSS